MKVRKMKNFSLVALSTLILTARQSVHASGTLLVFTNFTNLASLFDLEFKPGPPQASLAVLLLEMKVRKMKNFSLVALSTSILTARQSVHASGTLLAFMNFTNFVIISQIL